jgi:UDP-glucose 4-epimerase
VLHAFAHGKQGDIFVQKAPASTIGDLSEALKQIFQRNVPTEIIGTRHGEKLYETLVSREEMAKAEDMGRYFRIPADNRDLNYELFISEGNPEANAIDDYTSHNTERLDPQAVAQLLVTIASVRDELAEYQSHRVGVQ